MPTRTAAQRREQARADYDAFLADCPARKVLDRISDKWVTLILARWLAARSATATWAASSPGSARRCSPRPCARWSVTAWSAAR